MTVKLNGYMIKKIVKLYMYKFIAHNSATSAREYTYNLYII